MALVKRDAFARQELHRERFYTRHGDTCSWCGGVKKTETGREYLYSYRIETDSGEKYELKGLFCEESCRKAYNNE